MFAAAREDHRCHMCSLSGGDILTRLGRAGPGISTHAFLYARTQRPSSARANIKNSLSREIAGP